MTNEKIARFKEGETAVIQVVSAKGGVCKSTSAFCLATMLSTDSHKRDRNLGHKRKAKKVLVIDMDSQNNVSKSLLGRENYEEYNERGNLIKGIIEQDLTDYIIQVEDNENLYVIQSGMQANTVFDTIMSTDLKDVEDNHKMLSNALRKANEKFNFDYVFIDHPPELKNLTVQALSIDCFDRNACIIPLQIDSVFVDTIQQVEETIEEVKELNDKLEIVSIVPDLHCVRTKDLETTVNLEILRESFENVTTAEIRNNKNMIYVMQAGLSEEKAADRKNLSYYYDLIRELNLNNYYGEKEKEGVL